MSTIDYHVHGGHLTLVVHIADHVPEIDHFAIVRKKWRRFSTEIPDRVERVTATGREDVRWRIPRPPQSLTHAFPPEPVAGSMPARETWP